MMSPFSLKRPPDLRPQRSARTASGIINEVVTSPATRTPQGSSRNEALAPKANEGMASDLFGRSRERAERIGEVEREILRPEEMDVGALLEADVLENRGGEHGERKHLALASKERRSREQDGSSDFAEPDGERRERKQDPVATALEHLLERQFRAARARFALSQKLREVSESRKLDDVERGEQRHERHGCCPECREAFEVEQREPAAQNEAAHEESAEHDRVEHEPRPVEACRENHPEHGKHGEALARRLEEANGRERRERHREHRRNLEGEEARVRERDRRDHVSDRGDRAGNGTPQRSACPVKQERHGAAHQRRRQTADEIVVTECADEERRRPEHAPRVVTVVVARERRLGEITRNGSDDVEAQHVLSAQRDGRRGGVMSRAERRSDFPERDGENPNRRKQRDDARAEDDASIRVRKSLAVVERRSKDSLRVCGKVRPEFYEGTRFQTCRTDANIPPFLGRNAAPAL